MIFASAPGADLVCLRQGVVFVFATDRVRVAGSKCGVLQRAADADKHPGQRANRWRSKGIARRGHGAGQSRRPAPLKSLDASGTSSGFHEASCPSGRS